MGSKKPSPKLFHMARGQPHSSWAISLAGIKGVLIAVPGVVKSGTDVINCSNPGARER